MKMKKEKKYLFDRLNDTQFNLYMAFSLGFAFGAMFIIVMLVK